MKKRFLNRPEAEKFLGVGPEKFNDLSRRAEFPFPVVLRRSVFPNEAKAYPTRWATEDLAKFRKLIAA